MSDLARKRWRLLGEVLSNRRHRSMDNSLSSVSVRRFTSFGLLTTRLAQSSDTANGSDQWYLYTCEYFPLFRALIRHVTDQVTIETLLGFNNTGNVCVWPSEEVLAYYCLKHSDMFIDKSICELGGGMTCLAGIALATSSEALEVLLTDGNEQSVDNVQQIINRNSTTFRSKSVHSRLLRWSKDETTEDLKERFDFVISADCLFFDDARQDLAVTILHLLRNKGEALIVAPRRGDTLHKFVGIASSLFVDVQVIENYDERVTDLHVENMAKGLDVYDESIHYPLLLRLLKTMPTKNS